MAQLRIALEVRGVGSPDPRGIVTLKRLYAQACSYLARTEQAELWFTGTKADHRWLQMKGLLEKATFRRFHVPGRFQRIIADTPIAFLPTLGLVGNPQIYHSSTIFPFQIHSTKVVGTLVDFVPIRVPDCVPMTFALDQMKWCQWASVHPQAKWIAISDSTKRDAISLGRVHEKQIESVPLGVEQDVFSVPSTTIVFDTLDRLGIQRPYFLCVNTLNLRKNHGRLLEAWQSGQFASRGWSLILVGHPANNPLAIKLQAESYGCVKWLGYVPREDLLHLYYGCEGFVYPSLYEGYGIPVAEAIVAGKAILTSKNSAMSDLATDGAICVDPLSVESIEMGLAKLLDKSLRETLGYHNWQRRNDLSLERMAEAMLTAYRRLE